MWLVISITASPSSTTLLQAPPDLTIASTLYLVAFLHSLSNYIGVYIRSIVFFLSRYFGEIFAGFVRIKNQILFESSLLFNIICQCLTAAKSKSNIFQLLLHLVTRLTSTILNGMLTLSTRIFSLTSVALFQFSVCST